MQSFGLPVATAMQTENGHPEEGGKHNHSSINMKTWASRLTLNVKGVRYGFDRHRKSKRWMR